MKKPLVLILGIVSILGIFTVNATEYSNEMVEVYNRAYENGIISETTIDDANLYNTLTNKELADIMNKYAENVIGLTPNTSIDCQFDDISDLTTEEQNTIIKSCQLGLMPGDLSRSSFLPNEKTNRATFGSALSRVLWGNKYEGGTPYYANHLNALKAAGIMNIITNAEFTKEVRGYVMLMLMRSETSNAVVDCDDADIAFACFDPDYTELYENCPMECRNNEIDNNQFSEELTDAYIRAYEKGIISASNIDEADLYNSLTNLELADIMNKYSENVIGLTPNTSIDCQFDDIFDLTTEEQNTIIKSCQLGLMPGDLSRSSFLPNEKTNRATFGSALSRALWGNNYEGGNPYYINHLNAIKAAGIMNQIANAESTKEIRGYVLLILMRSETSNIVVDCDNADIAFACFDPDYTELYENCPMECRNNEIDNNQFSEELIKAYTRAYENGIITDSSIEIANLEGNITNVQLAKYFSIWGTNVIGYSPDTSAACRFTDTDSVKGDLKDYITLACQLGIMGQESNEFKPWELSSHAEFATALSRALWGNKYEGGTPSYTNHLNALQSIGIMEQSNPEDITTQGYALIMLMKATEYILAESGNNTAILIPGENFNAKIKNIVDLDSIKTIKKSENKIDGLTDENLINKNGSKKVRTWFDNKDNNGTLYYYTEADEIYLNEDSKRMFKDLINLADTSGLSGWNASNVTNMSHMFHNCGNLTDLSGLSGWDTSNVTDMSRMFYINDKIEDTSGLSGWNTSNVTNMSHMFYGCSLTNTSGLSNWNTSSVTDMSYMFNYCTSLTELDLSNWNTSNVTNMSSMFGECYDLRELDLSSWDTSKVTNMSYMFEGCSSLTNTSGLSNWNISNVTNIEGMFWNCTNLTDTSGLSNWNISNVTDMSHMFYGCNNLTNTSGLSNRNTKNVTDIGFMFYGCNNLTDISGLSNRNTSSVTDMSYMFEGCSSLAEADLSNWDTSNVDDMSRMFNGCNNLERIYTSNKFTTEKITHSINMFSGCFRLIGGNGTIYNANHTDIEYARIDTTETPGYFTDKNQGNIQHTVMFDYNGGTGVYSQIQTDEQKIILPGASRQKDKNGEWIFEGRFISSGNSEKIGYSGDKININNDITLYAHRAQTITILNPNNSHEGFTIMDRNLGATSNDISDMNSYGYKYQWGNNYGFLDGCHIDNISCSDSITTSAKSVDTDGAERNDDYYNKGYNGTHFIKDPNSTVYDYWKGGIHPSGLWGGANDNETNNFGIDILSQTETYRQGPCPTGYHVPSAGEWGMLIKYWRDTFYPNMWLNGQNTLYNGFSEGEEMNNFMTYFKLPYAGQRKYDSAELIHTRLGGFQGYYWTSTPSEGIHARVLRLVSSKIEASGVGVSNSSRGYGNSIRCFKNSLETNTNKVYTATLTTSPSGYGSVSKESLKASSGTLITIKGNTITIGGTTITATPQKATSQYTYTFSSWTNNCGNKLNKDCIITANFKRTSKTSNGGGGGGGGGSTSNKDNKTNNSNTTVTNQNTGDNTSPQKITTGNNENTISTGKENKLNNEELDQNKIPSDSNIIYPTDIITYKQGTQNNGNPTEILQNGYTREMNNAYQFAHENGITTTNNIENAKINSPLTRIAMAKMLSYYAINILGQKPDTSKNIQFNDVTDKQNSDYNNAVTLSYQLGIMGQGITRFRPNDEVTRAEFTTALSRMLYNTEDGKGNTKYYEPHMKKLYNEGIITKNDPNIKEMRGYVMIMLMRSSK